MNPSTTNPDLLPCPFCGAGKTEIEERPLDRMPRMDGKPSPIISATVRHWCPARPGQPTGLNISMHGRDRESAIAAWNRRALPPGKAYTPASIAKAEGRE